MSYRRPVLLSIAAGVLGLIVNLFPIATFTGVLFYFGEALCLSAGILFGPVFAVLAAMVASLATSGGWHHLRVVLLFAAEGLAVSWAVRRHGIQPVLAGFVF